MSKQWPRVLNWPQKLPVRVCVTVKGRNTLPGLTLRALWNRFFFFLLILVVGRQSGGAGESGERLLAVGP